MEFNGLETVIIAIFVLYLGMFLTDRISPLKKFNIPAPVTGGLICSVVILFLALGGLEIGFDMKTRDSFLLIFFATVGLSAKLRLLLAGGKTFVILLGVTVLFLIAQNLMGLLGASLVGLSPAYGLMAGTISFAGGHGTAVTWGSLAESYGISGATEFGLAAATFGLIAGGVIGGPIAHRLIARYHLTGNPEQESYTPGAQSLNKKGPLTCKGMIDGILLIALCVAAGLGLQEFFKSVGFIVPDFLPVLLAGVVFTNLMEVFKLKVHPEGVSLLSDVSLQIFLAISLMSMQLITLKGAFGPLIVILLLQILTMGLFARFLVFPLSGKDYDATVISSGFAGLGLGATPVGIANMRAVTERFGASPKAFFIIPLIGAFFLDIANALIIKMILMFH